MSAEIEPFIYYEAIKKFEPALVIQGNHSEVQKLNAQTPFPFHPIAKHNLIEKTRLQSESLLKMKNDSSLVRFFIRGDKYFSKQPIEKLSEITLNQMKLPFRHLNHFILCRTYSPSSIFSDVKTLVEDRNGDLIQVSFLNFQKDLLSDPNTWLPLNTIFIIKEPFLKFANFQKYANIEVDSPSDIIFVDEADTQTLRLTKWARPCQLSFDQLKSEANKFYSQKNYKDALKLYDRALKLNPLSQVIHSNKSAVYLQMERYYDAYQSGNEAFGIDSNEIDRAKILFRLGVAAYGMKKWQLSIDHFTECLTQSSNYPNCSEELGRAKKRLAESLTGIYNMKEISRASIPFYSGQSLVDLDVADYIGPVKTSPIPGKGYGVIATRKCPKGTLLFAVKPFSISIIPDNVQVQILNDETRMIATNPEFINIQAAIEALQRKPYLQNEFYFLDQFSRDSKEVLPDGTIDPIRIENIIKTKSLTPDNLMFADFLPKLPRIKSTGIWYWPLLMNHSCSGSASAHTYFHGDLCFCKTIKDVEAGEEITSTYLAYTPYKERSEYFNTVQRFTCTCPVCTEEARDENTEKRAFLLNKVMTEIKTLNLSGDLKISKLTQLIGSLDDLYEPGNRFKYDLYSPLVELADTYFFLQKFQLAVQYYRQSTEYKWMDPNKSFPVCAKMCLCLQFLGKKEEAAEILRDSVLESTITSGIGAELFRIRNKDLLEACQQMSLFNEIFPQNQVDKFWFE